MKVWTTKVRVLAPVALLCSLVFVPQPARAQQTFSFPNFDSAVGLTLNGDAKATSNGNANVLRITHNDNNLKGSTWYTTALPLQAGFTTTFTFQFTGQGGSSGHADGIAFVVQRSPIGTQYLDTNIGGSIGYGDDDGDDNPQTGIANSVAIEFDTFKNGWDTDDNHVAIQSCWDGNNSQHHGAKCANGQRAGMNPQLALGSLSSFNININDGAVHTAIITYAPPCANCQNLTVLLDGQQVAATALDLANLGLDATDDAFVGFTASTGGGFENQDILTWSFSAQTITQPVSAAVPTTFAFSNANGAELTHTVDFSQTPKAQLFYPNGDAGTIKIQSTNTSVDAATWPQYVVGGPFAPSALFPIVEDNPNGVGTNGALFVDLCFDPTLSGNAAIPLDANCPSVQGGDSNTPLLAVNVVADLASKPDITPGTTTALAHYEPTAPSTAPWAPSTTSSNPACVTTTGASGGTQPAPPTACNVFNAQNQISGDQTTSSGRVRSKGTFAMINGVPMLLSTVTVNGTPVNAPPVNNNVPISGGLWFSSPLKLGFTVNPACIPGQCPWGGPASATSGNNFFTPAPVAGETFDIVGVVDPTPATPVTTVPPFDTASVRPVSFQAQQTLADGQYTLEWSAVDNVGILEQNQQRITQALGPCPGADQSAAGTQCYITSLFNAPLNVDSTPPVITSTNAGQTYKAGSKVAASFLCTDPTPGAGTASCVNNGPANLDTTPTTGTSTTKSYTVTAIDKAIPPNMVTTPITYFVSCNYAAVTLNPSTLSKAKLPALIGITASVTDCMTASQKVVVNFSVSGPIGKNCAAGNQSLFSTPPFTIKSGTASSITFPFPILRGSCAGTYTVTTTTTVQGSNQLPDVVNSTLTITN